jgi:hypothetical protein
MINFIKKIRSMLFLEKNIENNSPSKNQNYFDIFISLDKNFNINVLISIDDTQIETMTENNTALVYYEFLNSCFTANIQNTVLQILKNDIKDESNKNLINKINTLIEYNQYTTDDSLYIKPSQVFIKHSNDTQ